MKNVPNAVILLIGVLAVVIIIAVSYTHLDVYKRQKQDMPMLFLL